MSDPQATSLSEATNALWQDGCLPGDLAVAILDVAKAALAYRLAAEHEAALWDSMFIGPDAVPSTEEQCRQHANARAALRCAEENVIKAAAQVRL